MKLTDRGITNLKELYSKCDRPTTNLSFILSYIRHRKNEGWADNTLANDLKALIELSRATNKVFEEVSQDDLYSFFDDLNSRISFSSVKLYKAKLRIFFRFIKRNDLADICISKKQKSKEKLPEDLLTQKDIEKLINTALNLRDKAFIALLYESGARKGEIMDIQVKHVQFDEQGAVVTLPKGKTGARRIRIVFATGYLRNWIDNHPDKKNRDDFIWASTKYEGKVMGYRTAWGNLQRLARKAGIQKRVNPHSFRHARATHLAKDLTEQQLKIYLGWTAGSSMAATYVHLSGKDVDNAILKLNGIEVQEKGSDNALKTIKCPRCKEMQNENARYCFKCGLPLSAHATVEIPAETATISKEFLAAALMDPEMQIMIKNIFKN